MKRPTKKLYRFISKAGIIYEIMATNLHNAILDLQEEFYEAPEIDAKGEGVMPKWVDEWDVVKAV